MSISKTCNSIFQQVIDDYHLQDFVQAKKTNPYSNSKLFEKMIYNKCWIDTIQWHLEDIIRKPDISPKEALQIKRKIDSSNQDSRISRVAMRSPKNGPTGAGHDSGVRVEA